MSLLEVIKNNAQLNRQMQEAAKVRLEEASGGVSREKYDGPDGEFVCTFNVRSGEKDGVPYVLINFTIAEGEDKGKDLGMIYFKLVDTERATVLQVLERLNLQFQRLGVQTAGRALDEIEKDVSIIQLTKKVKVALVTKNGYKNCFLNGLASVSSQDAPEAPPEESGEWNELDNESPQEASESLSEGEEGKPSDWVGFDVKYKTSPRAAVKSYQVVGADDAALTVDIKDDSGKVLEGIRFTSLILED